MCLLSSVFDGISAASCCLVPSVTVCIRSSSRILHCISCHWQKYYCREGSIEIRTPVCFHWISGGPMVWVLVPPYTFCSTCRLCHWPSIIGQFRPVSCIDSVLTSTASVCSTMMYVVLMSRWLVMFFCKVIIYRCSAEAVVVRRRCWGGVP